MRLAAALPLSLMVVAACGGDDLSGESSCRAYVESVREKSGGWIEYLHAAGYDGDGSELGEQPITANLLAACEADPKQRLGDALAQARGD